MYIDVPQYNKDGFKFMWEDGYIIQCSIEGGSTIIKANSQGLISLARHMLELSQETVPPNQHFHLDMYNSLEDNSTELIIVKSSGDSNQKKTGDG